MYHNDIKPGNICYTFENNELNIFLIDLDSIDFKKRTGCTKTAVFSPGLILILVYYINSNKYEYVYNGCDHSLDFY